VEHRTISPRLMPLQTIPVCLNAHYQGADSLDSLTIAYNSNWSIAEITFSMFSHLTMRWTFSNSPTSTAISRGFAAVCERCKELPALHDSKYCSGTCSNGADTRGQSHGQPSVGAVPQGFAAACQDCRRPMPVGDSNRRFCRQCENANRSHNISHR
jgi:hypothetical protein